MCSFSTYNYNGYTCTFFARFFNNNILFFFLDHILICSGDEYELLEDSYILTKFLIVILMKTLLFRVVYNHQSNFCEIKIPLTLLCTDVLGIHNTCVYKILHIQYITKY